MYATIGAFQILGLILVGIIGGIALISLLLGLIAANSGDDSGVGCSGIGGALLLLAAYIAIRIIAA